MTDRNSLYRVLDLARWAPSGDNTQPWRFRIIDEDRIELHCSDTRHHCVYDLCGRASQLSVGALLETLHIAASSEGLFPIVVRHGGSPDQAPVFDIAFFTRPHCEPDPLVSQIKKRCVKRGWLSTAPLTETEKQALQAAAGPGYRLRWLESARDRLAASLLSFRAGHIRYTIPEAWPTHRAAVQWNAHCSQRQIPDRALGLNPLSLRLTRFMLADWARIEAANRYLGSAWTTAFQMDLMPGLMCSAHFLLVKDSVPCTLEDYLDAGRAVQRVWLTASSFGLWQQPEMASVAFASYVRQGVDFTALAAAQREALRVDRALCQLAGVDSSRVMWKARLGAGAAPAARSARLDVEQLLLPAAVEVCDET